MRPSVLQLTIAVASVFAVSFFGYAQLGGPDGVLVPYTGRLDLSGAPATGPYDFTFHIYDAPVGGSLCWSGQRLDVPVSAGAFSVVLGPIDEACVSGQAAYLELEVQGPSDNEPVPLVGRQRLHGALSAHTSAPGGDFHISESLWVGATADTSVGDTTAPLLVGDPDSQHLALDSNEVLAREGVDAATLHLQSGGGDTAIGANGGGNVGIGRANPAYKLHVDGTARVSETLSVGGDVSMQGDVSVSGTVTWSCPPGTSRVGTSCVSQSRGAGTIQEALRDCHELGMHLCPADVVALCDLLDAPTQANGQGCGQLTDSNLPVAILTSTFVTDDPSEAAFSNFGCFWGTHTSGAGNVLSQCSSGSAYYCCSPVSAP